MIKQAIVETEKTPSIETGLPCKYINAEGEPVDLIENNPDIPNISIEKVAKILDH